MLFSNNDQENKEGKKNNGWSFFLTPGFKNDIRPLGDNLRMFARMIMYLLAAQKLFPTEHPAFKDESIAISLREVLSIAYGQISFTKEGLPKVILFFAVLGILVFSGLFLVFFLLNLFIGSAHAQSSMFTAPGAASNCDLAILWVNYLFLSGDPNSSASCVGGAMAPAGQLIQSALKAGLSIYSSAVLILAGFILMYHLTVMVAEQALHGKIMGRANQIWAPIRLIFAIGLLVPIAATGSSAVGGAGLNTAQFLVIQVAKWGSGLGSYVWGEFTDDLTTFSNSSRLVIPEPPSTEGLVKNAILLHACRLAYNMVVTQNLQPFPDMIPHYLIQAPVASNQYGIRFVNFVNNPDTSVTKDIVRCGSISGPPAPRANQSAEIDAMLAAIHTSIGDSTEEFILNNQDVREAANGILNYLSPAYTSGVSPTGIPDREAVINSVNNATRALRTSLRTVMSAAVSGGSNNTWQTALSDLHDNWSEQGWVMAGSWFNTIARAQGGIFDQATSSFEFNVKRPELEFLTQDIFNTEGVRSANDVVTNAMLEFTKLLKDATEHDPVALAQTGSAPKADSLQLVSVTNQVFSTIDTTAQQLGLWGETGFAVRFGDTVNPFAELVAKGRKLLILGFNLVTYAGLGTVGASLADGLSGVVGKTISPALGASLAVIAQATGGLLAFIIMVGTSLIVAGVMLGFYIPLVPFIKFFFNVLTWILSLFEAVVSAPLFALGHLTPYGEGLPGNMAQKGYFFLLDLLLRPVLLVFGLMAGLLIFYVAIYFLNAAFEIAALGVGSSPGGMALVAKIIYSMIYALMVYICANSAFKSISFFANHGLQWMSGSPIGAPQMGDQGVMQSGVGVATAYVGQKSISAITDGARSGAKHVGGVPEQIHDAKQKKISDAADAKFRATTEGHYANVEQALNRGNNQTGGGSMPLASSNQDHIASQRGGDNGPDGGGNESNLPSGPDDQPRISGSSDQRLAKQDDDKDKGPPVA